MKKHVKLILIGILISGTTYAQNLASGFNAGKGKVNIVAFTSYDQYSGFWKSNEFVELSSKMDRVIIKSVGVYVEYGITDKLDIGGALPYVTSQTKNDVGMEVQNGFQDGSLFLKYNFYQLGKIKFLGTLGYSGPLSDYDPGVFNSIGHSVHCADARLLVHYKSDKGFFANAQVGYQLRNGAAPNRIISGVKLGYAAQKIYVDGWFESQQSLSGTELGTPEGKVFSSNKISYMKTGATLYYPIMPKFGISLGGSYVLSGKNIGKYMGVSAGVVLKL